MRMKANRKAVFKNVFLSGVALALSFAGTAENAPKVSRAGERMLWPSAEAEMKAQEDSRIARLPDGAMGVVTGTRAKWPGMRLDFKAGTMDLSGYGRITIAVSNTTDAACTVHLSVKGGEIQGQGPGGSVALAPFACGEICADLRNMPWVLDRPLTMVGMRGYPTAVGGSTFDIRRTRSFHIFFSQPRAPGGFSVKRVTVSGDGVAQKPLKADAFFPFVDRFGQFKHDDWPGKIHDEAELKAAAAEEDKWLAAHAESPIPGCDRFGGWAAGPQLKATGFFRTEKVNGKWWLVDPDGRLFFSHGVDCVRLDDVTGVGFREKYFEDLPDPKDPVLGRFFLHVAWPQAHGFYKDPAHVPYRAFAFGQANALRKYGPDWSAICRTRAHRRIRAWGLNTIANWSDGAICRMARTPYTATFGTKGPVIEGSSGWWGKLRDPFAPAFIANAQASAAKEAKNSGSDPWCIGWFVDNELSWGHDNRDLARAVLRSPARQPAKQAFRAALAVKYDTVAKLDAAWGTRYGSWEGFLAATNAVDETRAGRDLEDFHRRLVAQYFRTIREAIKAAAPNRLYLGTRIAWGADVIYEESARYCDVVSVNIYYRRPARDLPTGAVDKPMINGEFHFGALDRGLFHTGLVATRDQNERAQCYRAFVNACLDHPRYVGTHWFQWQDQPITGRGDGENYQIGFVTITDAPYPELVEAARDVGRNMYARRYRAARSD